jgi:glycosyltransferase involved in cell wall biosynthesis
LRAEIARAGCRAEIIVVDNNSTDGTRRIASLVPGVVVVDEPQRGLVQARRAGCLAAKGDLIANIDADTMLTEGWLCTALAEFSRSPDLVALSGPCIYYDLPRSAQFIAAVFYRIAFATYLFVRFVLGAGSMIQGGQLHHRQARAGGGGWFQLRFPFLRRIYRFGLSAEQGWTGQVFVATPGLLVGPAIRRGRPRQSRATLCGKLLTLT